MDPVSILSIIGTCASLSLGAGKLAVALKGIAGQYKDAELNLRCLSTQCKSFAAIVGGVQRWMEDGPDDDRLDQSVWNQLSESLEMSEEVMSRCDKEMQPLMLDDLEKSLKGKAKVVWNLDSLKEHEHRLRGQTISLSALLQVINLPLKLEQKQVMLQHQSAFEDSRSSVEGIWSKRSSIISTNSTLLRGTQSQSQLRFSFDELLLKSQVYNAKDTGTPPSSAEATDSVRTSRSPAPERGLARERPEKRDSVATLSIGRMRPAEVPKPPTTSIPHQKSSFPHAFERWETLSSHWEGLTSYWLYRLQEHAELYHPYKLDDQVLSRQITDLSAAGANLFHAVVELQRLRASSERKFQRWFFETRSEMEKAQERQTELEQKLATERETATSLSKLLQQRLIESTEHAEHEALQKRYETLQKEHVKERKALGLLHESSKKEYETLQTEHAKRLDDSRRLVNEMDGLSKEISISQSALQDMKQGMEDVVKQELDTALAEKNAEIERLQNQLKTAKEALLQLKLQLLKHPEQRRSPTPSTLSDSAA